MNISTNGEYNPCQLNETINFSPDGRVLSKSLMLNLRGEKPKDVYKSYQELWKLINGEEAKPKKETKRKAQKEVQKEKKQEKKDQEKDNPGNCPKCGAPLIHRSGISRNGRAYNFHGCSAFPICEYTRNIPDKEAVPVADEDLLTIEE